MVSLSMLVRMSMMGITSWMRGHAISNDKSCVKEMLTDTSISRDY